MPFCSKNSETKINTKTGILKLNDRKIKIEQAISSILAISAENKKTIPLTRR